MGDEESDFEPEDEESQESPLAGGSSKLTGSIERDEDDGFAEEKKSDSKKSPNAKASKTAGKDDDGSDDDGYGDDFDEMSVALASNAPSIPSTIPVDVPAT